MRFLLCLTLAGVVVAQGPADLETQVNAALDRARPGLIELAKTQRGGELALLCLALVNDDVPRDDIFQRAINRLEGTTLTGTYELSLRLMVMAALEEYPDRERASRRDLKRLLRNQTSAGGFGYGQRGSAWDLSNTQYGALGMRAALSLGCEIKEKRWQILRRAVEKAQTASGGFAYRPSSSRAAPYASMTVAGIAVMELCLQHLRGKGTAAKIGKRLQRAWRWMEEHKNEIGKPEAVHAFYFHYGLERAAILSGISNVDGVDWYEAGAKMLLEHQGEQGGWSRYRIQLAAGGEKVVLPRDPVATSFAVLFLRRKFQRRLGPITKGGGYLTRGLPEGATEKQIARAVELDVDRGARAVPDLLKALRSPILARRKAAVLGLSKISGEDFGLDPLADPSASSDAIKAAERWWLTKGRRGLRGK